MLCEAYPRIAYAVALAETLPTRAVPWPKTRSAWRAIGCDCLARGRWVGEHDVRLCDLDGARSSEDAFVPCSLPPPFCAVCWRTCRLRGGTGRTKSPKARFCWPERWCWTAVHVSGEGPRRRGAWCGATEAQSAGAQRTSAAPAQDGTNTSLAIVTRRAEAASSACGGGLGSPQANRARPKATPAA